MKTATRRYARRQLTWMRKLPDVTLIDVTGRAAGRRRAGGAATCWHDPRVRFEKWQALGNDYLIVEERPLTPELVRQLCDRHFGVGADGVLQLEPPDEPGFVARLRIFNPDGSEAELSGNGARQAILYLRHRGWTDADTFSIQTIAGEIRPTITGPTTCRVDMGRASLTSKDYPGGPPDGTGVVEGLRLPARLDRQPAVRDPHRRRATSSRRST